jgi:pSer/pThr/pTyr-binding forkhead associated (FHA) protein
MPGETDTSDPHSEEETSDDVVMDTARSDMPEVEGNKEGASDTTTQQDQESGQDDAETKKGPEKTDFDSDKTAIIPRELIGSNPERLLEPALQVQTQTGWDRYFLSRDEINIGNIRNPESEIALYDAQVSRRHAKVIFDQMTDCWFFIDMASTNGSTLNGKKVEPHHPVKLSDSDSITVGDTRIEVYIP